MSFTASKQGDITIIEIEGQLIVGNRQDLKQKVLDEVEKGAKKVLIDFERTGYIDSSGLGVLVSLAKRIRDAGGELRLANLHDELQTLEVEEEAHVRLNRPNRDSFLHPMAQPSPGEGGNYALRDQTRIF